MKAVYYEKFGQRPTIETLPDPTPTAEGLVIKVEASGVCRSDFHGWGGHDPVIQLPHVPGHELSGVVEAVGTHVVKFKPGDRVTVPFVGGCGSCPECHAGHQQVCDAQFQPGFTHWGSFAQLVAVDYADLNVVDLPDEIDFITAASLGCRFATSFRAIVDRSGLKPGQWLAIHGCGGIGLSAIMIARSQGARIVGVDINNDNLKLARKLGAEVTINSTEVSDLIEAIRDTTDGGAHVSVDALGIPETCTNSVRSLRKRGRHIQLGWMLGDDSSPPVPMDLVMGWELEIVGSHGMQAHRYDEMIRMITAGHLAPQELISESISLAQAADALADFDTHPQVGVTVISDFS